MPPLIPESRSNAGLLSPDLFRLLGLLLLVRLGVLMLIGWIAHGQPFTSDTGFQLEFIRDPMLLLEPRPDSVYRPPFPPLIPLLMAALVRPFQWFFSDFYAVRLGYIAFELLALPLIWGAWGQFSRTRRLRWALGLAYVLSPLGVSASAVLAQEETIAMLFSAAAVWLVLEKRLASAALVCGLGVVAGKIFLAVALLAVIAGPSWRPWGEFTKRVVCGFAPVVLVYGYAWLNGASNGTTNSFETFIPPNAMCVTAYSLFEIKFEMTRMTAMSIARPLSAGSVLLVLALARLRGPIEPGPWLVALMTAMLLALYATFSHINPEHWLILIPMMPFAFRHRTTTAIFILHFAVAVAINVTYGVAAAGGFPKGRAPFVRLYNAVMPIEAITLHTPLVLIFVVTSLVLAISATVRVTNRTPIGQPASGPRSPDPAEAQEPQK